MDNGFWIASPLSIYGDSIETRASNIFQSSLKTTPSVVPKCVSIPDKNKSWFLGGGD